MDKLAKAVKEAAKIHEESWDGKTYAIGIQQAADTAAENAGFDVRGTTPIYLLLKLAWNDILEWTQHFD